MEVPAWFFNQLATIQPQRHPQDKAGGEVPTATTLAVQVPVCVQQDSPPDPVDRQGRRASVAAITIFFRPKDGPSVAAVKGLKKDDNFAVTGWANPMVLDGTPFDRAGRGVVWEASARNGR